MGNCAIKPKVLKDSEEDLVPVERDSVAPVDHHDKDPAPEKSENNAPNPAEEEEAAAAARRSEKGKEILIEDDVDENHKRPSLSHLFHEDKTVVLEKEVIDLSPIKSEANENKTGPSEVPKLDTSALTASTVKAPEETFDVQTRNDLEVKIPKDSEVKSPETPKAKEAEENFSENWEVKFPEELEAKKTSEVVKVEEESKLPQVSAPQLSEVESNVPEVLEDKNIPEVSAPVLSEVKDAKESNVPEVLEDKNISEVSAPALSEIKVTKESDVPEVLEDKDIQEVKTDEVKVAESELLKVSEVKSTEDLDIKVPEVFEVKTPETSKVEVIDESAVKTDQEALNAKNADETKAPEFKDAQEKLENPEGDKEMVLPKTEEEAKAASLEKQVNESTTLPDLGTTK
ncbi:hypothetical protein CARUB_v10026529mg [Capsella rubella]|uniref:Uncharacterized protein n=1 Tax=Capsella rubella TaxID=81985 RepID=R0G7R7_9BRAS|nr:neurofilament heavy polypeptide [Capsella rubella]EOA12539.1 hypothetical protein CARUB_v10026529mg [Capsella rubella]